MSQTIVPPAPAGVRQPSGSRGSDPTASGASPGRVQALGDAIRHYLDRTPGRLRAVSAVALVAALLVGLGGGAALRERSGALDEAQRDAAHLVLVQRVQTALVQADADATNSFLAFGLEDRSQRTDYIDQINAAAVDLAAAADGGNASGLSAAYAALTRYTGYVASARANNLQGFPVGASYLQEAGDLLRKEILPRLVTQATADRAAVEAAYSRAGRAVLWLALVAIIGLGALVGVQIYLARHSRRILNLPLAAGSAGLLVAVLVAAAAMAVSQSQANDVRSGDLALAQSLSDSRVAAFNAKAIESLGLIVRGSGATLEPQWQSAYVRATASVRGRDAAAETALAAYEKKHDAIRELDDGGDWQKARITAIAGDQGSANAQFGIYAEQTAAVLQARADAAQSGLDDARQFLLPTGLLVVLVGLIAAVGAWRGISQRLDEYR